MQATPIDRCIPLPQHWHRHVRSAIVHAASMATIAFTRALVRAANNPDAQLRAHAEIDRLQREVDLLLEEARIKNARMARRRVWLSPGEPKVRMPTGLAAHVTGSSNPKSVSGD